MNTMLRWSPTRQFHFHNDNLFERFLGDATDEATQRPPWLPAAEGRIEDGTYVIQFALPVSTGTRPGLRTSPRRGDRHATHRGQRHDDARRVTRRVQPPSVPEVRGPCQWPPLAQRRVESGADRDGQTTMISVLGVPLKGRRETHVRVGHAVTVGTHSRRRRTATRLRRLTRRGFAVHAILYSLLCLTTTAPRVGDPQGPGSDLYRHRHRARGRRARSGCVPSRARRAPSRTARPPAVASPVRPPELASPLLSGHLGKG